MAMKRAHVLSLLITGVAIALTGCVIIERDVMYNNSGQELIIMQKYLTNSPPRTIKYGETFEFYASYIEIRHGNDIWQYGRKPFALEFHKRINSKNIIKFYKRIGGNQILVKLQVQPDGSIYLIPPDSNGPVTDFPEQPEGFPLKPQDRQ